MRKTISILKTKSWNELAKLSLPSIENYCHKHGYTLFLEEVPEPFDGFRKLERIKELLNSGIYQLIWSLDLDVMITNPEIKFCEFAKENKFMFICRDVNGYNGGSFIIKNIEGVNDFINNLLLYKDVPKVYCEQDAITRFVFMNGDEKVRTLPHPSINSLKYELYPEHPNVRSEAEGDWRENHLLLHLPGIGMECRMEILKQHKK